MWPSRSNRIQRPSGDRSTDIQVPCSVTKSISRTAPRGAVTSHTGCGGAGDGWSDHASVASAPAATRRESVMASEPHLGAEHHRPRIDEEGRRAKGRRASDVAADALVGAGVRRVQDVEETADVDAG